MNNLFRAGLLLLLLLMAGLPARPAAADTAAEAEALLQSHAQLLFARINEVRANPLPTLARLGIDQAGARQALGADAWILDQGLPALAWSDLLHATAQGHGRDMLANLYYSYNSPDGRTPQARIGAAGYQAARADETIAALAFANHVALGFAADAMFDQMLRDELSGGAARTIFSPAFTEVGISFLADSAALFPGRPHVYLLVLDFAQPLALVIDEPVIEPPVVDPAEPIAEPAADPDPHGYSYLLWQRFNEARANPLATLARLGIPEATARRAFGIEAWILDRGLPPLAWNDFLRASAQGLIYDKHARFLDPAHVLDQRTAAERIEAAGCLAETASETVAIRVLDHTVEIDAVLTGLVDTMLRNELTGAFWVKRNIFSLHYTELGISLMEVGTALMTESEAARPDRSRVYLLVADFAQPAVPREVVIGRAEDGDQPLLLRDGITGWERLPLLPGNSFQFVLPQGSFEVIALDADGNLVAETEVLTLAPGQNYSIDLRR